MRHTFKDKELKREKTIRTENNKFASNLLNPRRNDIVNYPACLCSGYITFNDVCLF